MAKLLTFDLYVYWGKGGRFEAGAWNAVSALHLYGEAGKTEGTGSLALPQQKGTFVNQVSDPQHTQCSAEGLGLHRKRWEAKATPAVLET